MTPTMFTATCCETTKRNRNVVGLFQEGDIITFQTFLVNTDDSFNLTSGLFNPIKDGYYSFSFVGLQTSAPNFSETLRLAVYVNSIPMLKFQNFEAYENEFTGMDTISIAFNLKLQIGQAVALFIEQGQIICGQVANCVFNGRYVRPLYYF